MKRFTVKLFFSSSLLISTSVLPVGSDRVLTLMSYSYLALFEDFFLIGTSTRKTHSSEFCCCFELPCCEFLSQKVNGSLKTLRTFFDVFVLVSVVAGAQFRLDRHAFSEIGRAHV